MDMTTQFFDLLAQRGHIPLLEKAQGNVRFDIVDAKRADHYLVTIDRGDIRVSNEAAPAQCVIATDRALFENIAAGKQNAMAAMLRGAMLVEGDPSLAVLVQRLFSMQSDTRRT
jgi:putative sterol carrier protein